MCRLSMAVRTPLCSQALFFPHHADVVPRNIDQRGPGWTRLNLRIHDATRGQLVTTARGHDPCAGQQARTELLRYFRTAHLP